MEFIKFLKSKYYELTMGKAQGFDRNILLHKAIKAGNLDKAEWLIKKGADIEAKDECGHAPLYNAIESGNEAMVRMLLENGAHVNTQDKYGETLLHETVVLGREALVQLLLDNGADIDIRNREGYTPLMWAIFTDRNEMVKLLVENGADVDAPDNYGETPLGETPLYKAVRIDKKDVVLFLLKNKANINAQEKNGYTPLMCAVNMHNWAMVKLLVDKGADMTIKDQTGRTAFDHAEGKLKYYLEWEMRKRQLEKAKEAHQAEACATVEQDVSVSKQEPKAVCVQQQRVNASRMQNQRERM